ALSQALQGSGLFYESHLRDLVFGRRDAAQLRAEPQAQAGHEASKGAAGDAGQARAGTETAAGQNPQAAQQSGQASQAGQQGNAAQHQPATATPQSGTHLAGALSGLDPTTHVLVRQQLETLANQSLAWQGEAWPGADLEWEVQRREPQGGNGEETDSWATRLKLQLPGLGEVQARLSLSGSQLVMHLVSAEGASLMADHTDMLRQRLNLQGLLLSQLTISREDGNNTGAQS
ncbi:MAG: flagellar hook-length control protein FliK, partial [Burkholderiaceae bacterium]